MRRAAARIGTDLEVEATARAVVEVLVPALGHVAAVDLNAAVATGGELRTAVPPPEGAVVRFALAGEPENPMLRPGDTIPPISLGAHDEPMMAGQVVVEEDPWHLIAARYGEELAERLVPDRRSRGVIAPLVARGQVLGTALLYQDRARELLPDDVEMLQEIASRAGLALDNARRYTREHATAVSLQRMLLPRGVTDTDAAETAAVYRPAARGADIGGQWYDVIPLSSFRVGMVVGEAFGAGPPAAATMGRVRAAMLTLADLDLEPDELLTHVDDLVTRLAAEAAPGAEPVGARCVYAIHDPVAARLTLADAGHHAPVLLTPGRDPVAVARPAGAPLGSGGPPFETYAVPVEDGAVVAFPGTALVGHPPGGGADAEAGRTDDRGMVRLRAAITRRYRPDEPLEGVCENIVADTATQEDDEDAVLLVARLHLTPPENTARWTVPAEAGSVPAMRKAVTARLAAWGLDALALTTELIVGELCGNAVRHADGPMTVRLIRGRNHLVCEVADHSASGPHIRRARSLDEGGRGLFLVAQVSHRWGSRFTGDGKVIWAEQLLDSDGL